MPVSRLVPWFFAGLFLAGIAHIISILLLPGLSREDATSRLAAMGRMNRMSTLFWSKPSEMPIPFSDPNATFAICPYDLSPAPLRIRVPKGAQILTVAFLQSGGIIYYSLSDRIDPKNGLDIRLTNAAQLQAIEAKDPEDQPISELRVRSPSLTGVVLVRAISAQNSDAGAARQRVSASTCVSEPLAD